MLEDPRFLLGLVVFLVLLITVCLIVLAIAVRRRLRAAAAPVLDRYDEFGIPDPPPAGSHRQFDVGGAWRGSGGTDFRVAPSRRARA